MSLPDNCDAVFVDDDPALLGAVNRLGGRALRGTDLTHHCLLVSDEDLRRPSDTMTKLATDTPTSEIAEIIMMLRPGLVVSDFELPRTDGLQVLDQIRDVDPEWLAERDAVLKTGKLDRRKLLFTIASGGITSERRRAALKEAYERGDLGFLFLKGMEMLRALNGLLQGLDRKFTPEESDQIIQAHQLGMRQLLGVRGDLT